MNPREDNAPVVSVLMAVYNGAHWLREAIKSVLDQTLTDFEFIIVDDGSTDDTSAIIEGYAATDSRIVVLRKENTGLADSLNCGLWQAKGNLVARMDADDICKPYRLQRQVVFLEAHPEIALVSGAVEYIDEQGAIFGRTYPITSPAAIRQKILYAGNVIVHPAVMARRSIILACGGYCSELTIVEDKHLWRKLLRNGYQLAMLPETMIAYRVSGTAISNQKKTREQERLIRKILEYDSPPKHLLEAYHQQVKRNKERFTTAESRKAQIANTLHCKLWRVGKQLGIPDKLTERVVCTLQNTLATIRGGLSRSRGNLH